VTLETERRPSGLLRRIPLVFCAALLLSSLSCATFDKEGMPLVPTHYQVRTGPFMLFSNFPMEDDPPAVRCLLALERDLKRHLEFQSNAADEPVEIYVLDDRSAFAHFLKFYYPELPPRRAFFLAQGNHRVVYTYVNPRLEEDLRHEATHALLHGSFGDLPLWLDEGLAEYFENDLTVPGVEQGRIEQISSDLAENWTPDLKRLESLSDIRQMTPRDYREAWAWTHLLLNAPEPGKSLLMSSLLSLGQKPGPLMLWEKGATTERLIAHIKAPQAGPAALHADLSSAQPGPNTSAVRLQDKGAEGPAPQTPPRGLWRRLRAWIGL
jgi:Protein of unknown function (DUF1570)